MLPFETKIKIDMVTEEVLDFNNFKYRVCKGDIGPVKGLFIYIPEKCEIEEGDCLETDKAHLTGYAVSKDTNVLAVRVDKFRTVDPKDFKPVKEFVARCNGLVVKSEKCKMQYTGPERVPFIKCTLIHHNENRGDVKDLLIGRGRTAKLINEIENRRYINCTVTVRPYRKGGKCQFSIDEYKYVERKN